MARLHNVRDSFERWHHHLGKQDAARSHAVTDPRRRTEWHVDAESFALA